MPSMRPHTLCHLQGFLFPFEPLWELRKEVELNARKLRRFPQYMTQLDLKEHTRQNPRAGGKGEKCRHLLRERVALFSLNVLRALR